MGYLVLNALNNLLQELSSDSSQHVRSALASVIMGMAPVLGKVRISYIGLALVTKARGLEDLPACHALYYSGLFIFIWLISYLVFAWRVTFNLSGLIQSFQVYCSFSYARSSNFIYCYTNARWFNCMHCNSTPFYCLCRMQQLSSFFQYFSLFWRMNFPMCASISSASLIKWIRCVVS